MNHIEFDNITLQDIVTLRSFIDKYWKYGMADTKTIITLKPLIEVYCKLKDIEDTFSSQIGVIK
jgi:hypothetical protein